jgi:hypothetical protein
MNRKEYMAADNLTDGAYDGSKGHDAHHAYFAQFVTPEITATVLRSIGAKALLASRDVHLNDIPLRLWDALPHLLSIRAKAIELGDGASLSMYVGVYKTAARLWLKANGGPSLWRVRYRYRNDPGPHFLHSYAVGFDPVEALGNFRRVYDDAINGEIVDNGGAPLSGKARP